MFNSRAHGEREKPPRSPETGEETTESTGGEGAGGESKSTAGRLLVWQVTQVNRHSRERQKDRHRARKCVRHLTNVIYLTAPLGLSFSSGNSAILEYTGRLCTGS